MGITDVEWKFIETKEVKMVNEPHILFERIDKKVIEQETNALCNQAN